MWLVRAVHIAATVLLAGGYLFWLLVLDRRGADGPRTDIARWLRRLRGWSLCIATLSWLMWLGLVAAGMSGRPLGDLLGGDVLGAVLIRTTFGHVWLARFVMMVGLMLLLALGRRREAERVGGLGGLLATGLLAALAGTGHAVGTEPSMRLAHLAADAAHLLAAGLWLGALAPLLFVLARAHANPAPPWSSLAAKATERFSSLGILAVATLLATGLINASLLLGDATAILATPYGRLLALKLTLFALIVAIAAVNRSVLRPRLPLSGDWSAGARIAARQLWRNALFELLLGAAILAIVGALGTTEPPRHMHSADPGMGHHGGS
jgi:putative copper resistance protein D